MCFFQLKTNCPLDLKGLSANNGNAGVRERLFWAKARVAASF